MKKRTETPEKVADKTNGTPKKGARAWDRPGLPKWGPRWLAAFAESCNVSLACATTAVGRSTVYAVREKIEAFAEAWTEAEAEAVDALAAECRRRALHGVKRPVYQGGKLVGYVQEYSDTLAMFLLKAHRPEMYRERLDLRHSGQVRDGLPGVDDEMMRRLIHTLTSIQDDPTAGVMP